MICIWILWRLGHMSLLWMIYPCSEVQHLLYLFSTLQRSFLESHSLRIEVRRFQPLRIINYYIRLITIWIMDLSWFLLSLHNSWFETLLTPLKHYPDSKLMQSARREVKGILIILGLSSHSCKGTHKGYSVSSSYIYLNWIYTIVKL